MMSRDDIYALANGGRLDTKGSYASLKTKLISTADIFVPSCSGFRTDIYYVLVRCDLLHRERTSTY